MNGHCPIPAQLPSVHPIRPPLNVNARLLSVLINGFRGQPFRYDVLRRGLVTQRRWDERGDATNITLVHAGLDAQYAPLFQAEDALESALQSCVEAGMLSQSAQDTSSVFRVEQNWQRETSDTDTLLQGLIFLCFLCPREPEFDAKYASIPR